MHRILTIQRAAFIGIPAPFLNTTHGFRTEIFLRTINQQLVCYLRIQATTKTKEEMVIVETSLIIYDRPVSTDLPLNNEQNRYISKEIELLMESCESEMSSRNL